MEINTGIHACQLYESFDDQKRLALPYIKHGLAKGERCRLMTSAELVDDWCLELQAYGIDVDYEQRRGALEVFGGRSWGSPETFSSIDRAAKLWPYIEQSIGRFDGLRVIGDSAWELEPALPTEKVTHWEATLNLLFTGVKVRGICQYDLEQLSADTIWAALRTHQVVYYRGERYSNRFYQAERILEHEPHLNESHMERSALQEVLELLTQDKSAHC